MGAKDFIKTLLRVNPDERPTAQDAQSHPWLMSFADSRHDNRGTSNLLSDNVVEALVTFKSYDNMRKLICEIISFTLMPDQIKNLRKEFEKADEEGSGEISLDGLKKILKNR